MKRLATLLVLCLAAAMVAAPAAAAALDRAYARHADTWLDFPAFYAGWDSDDSARCLGASHALHPAVVFSPRGFLGYRFWMAYTPICISESDENPHLAVSNDGREWAEFTAASGCLANPVFDRSLFRAIHLSDADLLLEGDSILYLLFRATWEIAGVDSNALYASATVDGLVWTPPVKILSDGLLGQPRQSAFVSPALASEGDSVFILWVVEPRADGVSSLDTSRMVEYRAPHPFGPWALVDTCAVALPSDSLKIWHLEVLADTLFGRTALLNLSPNSGLNGGDSADLYMAAYDEAAALWTVAAEPVLTWRSDTSAWYGRRIYRASGVWMTTPADTILWLYYSAYARRANAGGAGTGWQTGLTWAAFDSALGPFCLAPSLRHEPNLEHVVGLSPTFQWLSADPALHRPQDEVSLELIDCTGGDSVAVWSVCVSGGGGAFCPDSFELSPGHTCVLRLRSRHGAAWSPWTALEFRTNAAPSPPACLYPPDQPALPLYDLTPAFFWSEAIDPDPGDPVRYRFAFCIADTCADSTDIVTDGISLTLADSLSVATAYRWTVASCDTFGACCPAGPPAQFRTFLPGDMTADFRLGIADLTGLVDILFRGGSLSVPMIGAEMDGRCGLTVADLTVLMAHLFRGGAPPPPGCR
ncbi:MAG TPA: hypothetical protein PKY95_02095 [candidate division Zixibacteria bacterium]|nr:hypothetical protein [candidate division Zixibacteria bacterium]